ncbi:hypothetical protein D9613_009204 [Agrocybe pediades]|uniref:Uncharacterized protein n=1 Tax=Agrocybe pediades TaxID=84607 RepID=A0A8H4R2M8_9AGAR|nr:hypothetical protein D9613_009204 [Agrocybe pediades]
MVHRPPDSRLLTNLLQQEKEYTKHLSQVLDASNVSLASFAAYAAASSPPVSQVIMTVAGSLAAADEALRKYAHGVEEWREMMRQLKDTEDEVANIMRDREILVTRLIKASKSQKPGSNFRDSLLLSHHKQSSSSSLSLSVGTQQDSPSPPPSRPLSSAFSSTSTSNSKLAAAQSELQACEMHLAAKERELALKRCSVVRDGLGARMKALANCGWAWEELGKEALRTLEELNVDNIDQEIPPPRIHEPRNSSSDVHLSINNLHTHNSGILNESSSPSFGLLPPLALDGLNDNSARPSSDFSSIGPSQSASQVNAGSHELHMPAPISLMNSGLFGDPPSAPKTVVVESVVVESTSEATDEENEENTTESNDESEHEQKPDEDSRPTTTSNQGEKEDDSNEALPPPRRPHSAFSGGTGGTTSSMHYSPILVATPTAALKLESAQAIAMRLPPRDSPRLGERTPRDSPRPSGSSTQNTTGEPPNPATTTTVVRIPPAHAFKENGYAYDIPTAESSPRTGPSTLNENANANVPGRPSSRASSNRSSSDRHGPAASSSGLGRLGLGTWHRPQIERRITEEEMRRSFNLDENERSRMEGQAQGQAQAPPEASSDEVEDEEELVRREKKLVKEGKLAVVENPRFMSEARRKELEKEKEREEEERRRVKEKEKEREKDKDKEKEKEEKKKRFTLFHTNSHSSQQQQQHGRSASVSFAGTGTTETPPSPSPSKSGFFGSLKGLFSNRPLASPTRKKEDHQANATTTTTTTTKTVDTPRAIDISDSDSELEAGASRGGAMHNLFSGGSKKGKGGSSGKWETRTDKNIQKLAKRESFDEDTITKRRKAEGTKPSLYAGGGVAAGVVAGVGLNMGSANGSAVRVAAGPGPASAGAGRGRTVSDVGVSSSAAGNARPPARRLTKKGKEREGERAGGGIPASVSAPAPAALVSVRAPPPVSTSAISSQLPSRIQQPQAQTQARLKHRRSASVDVDAQRRNSLHSNKTATTDDEGDTQNEDGGNGTSSGGEGMIVDLGRRRRRRAASEAGAGVRKESAEELRQGVVRRQRDEQQQQQRGRTAVPVAAVQAPAAAAGAERVAKKKSLTKKKQVEQAAAAAPPVTGTSTPMQTPSRQPSVKSSSATKAAPPPAASTTSYGATVLPAGGDHPSGTLVSQPGWKNQAQGTGGGLSRNNSIGSTASAPATPGSQAAGGRGKAKKRTVLGQGVSGASTGATGVGRRASLNAGSTTSTSGATSGSVVQPTPAIPSLMSIVEDVAKLNKEGWRKDLEKDRDRMPPPPKTATSTTTTVAKPKSSSSPVFEVPKAPPPVSREMLEGLGSTSVSSANQSRTSLATITPATSSPPPPVTTKKKAASASPPQSKSGNSSTGMFEIKAPGSVFNNQSNNLQRPTIARASSSATKAAVTNANTAFNTNPNNLTVGGSANAMGSGTGSLSRRPDKSPLRSALKDTSRSPSPAMHQQLHQDSSASAVPPPVNGSLPWGSDGSLSTQSSRPADKADDVKGKGKAKAAPVPAPPLVARRYSHESTGTSGDESYETGNEFYTEDEDQPPPPPIASKTDVQAVPKVALNGHALAGGEGYEYDAQKAASQSALSQSSVSTVTATRPSAPPSAVSSGGGSSQGQGQGQGQTPRRRKSVRVSLKPTFSPSPPAIEYDYEEEQNVYAPWSRQADAERMDRGRQREQQQQQSRPNTQTQVNGHQEPLPAPIPLRAPGLEPKTVVDVVAHAHESERDMWQDSGSDEDEEYARAKKLLTRAAKKERSVSRLAMVANRA